MRKNKAGPSPVPLTLGCALVLLLAAGCASSSSGQPAGAAASGNGPRVTVDAQRLPGVGTVLVTSKGYALYMFAPDNHAVVTCTGVCAGTWPPLKIAASATLVAGPGVQQTRLSSLPDPSGGRVVSYAGWPLYTYTGDVQPGQATGQNIDLNGGGWYVIRPSGQPLEPQP